MASSPPELSLPPQLPMPLEHQNAHATPILAPNAVSAHATPLHLYLYLTTTNPWSHLVLSLFCNVCKVGIQEDACVFLSHHLSFTREHSMAGNPLTT